MDEPSSHNRGFGLLALLTRWQRLPLYGRILVALAFGVIAGVVLGPRAEVLTFPARLILRLLGALAPPLILFAILQSLLTTKIGAGTTFRLARLLLLNTTVAILIGLLVANALQPGRRAHLTLPTASKIPEAPTNALTQFLDSVPDSLWRPLVENTRKTSPRWAIAASCACCTG
jgi:Na+/H+-dicarboxylate symporter